MVKSKQVAMKKYRYLLKTNRPIEMIVNDAILEGFRIGQAEAIEYLVASANALAHAADIGASGGRDKMAVAILMYNNAEAKPITELWKSAQTTINATETGRMFVVNIGGEVDAEDEIG